MSTLQLLQLNIERSKHFDHILPFLKEHAPEVLCIQEIYEYDVPRFEAVGYYSYFAPMNIRQEGDEGGVQGVALFSTIPMQKNWTIQYGGPEGPLPTYQGETPQAKHDTQRFIAAFADIDTNGTVFRIGTTHFPWTPDGSASDFQRADMRRLLSTLADTNSFVFTGDFNAPRGGEVFSMLASRYRDNVPTAYTSSIDGSLHKAGPLPYMVDGIFSSPEYRVSNMRMYTGVSDHCALMATISIEQD